MQQIPSLLLHPLLPLSLSLLLPSSISDPPLCRRNEKQRLGSSRACSASLIHTADKQGCLLSLIFAFHCLFIWCLRVTALAVAHSGTSLWHKPGLVMLTQIMSRLPQHVWIKLKGQQTVRRVVCRIRSLLMWCQSPTHWHVNSWDHVMYVHVG